MKSVTLSISIICAVAVFGNSCMGMQKSLGKKMKHPAVFFSAIKSSSRKRPRKLPQKDASQKSMLDFFELQEKLTFDLSLPQEDFALEAAFDISTPQEDLELDSEDSIDYTTTEGLSQPTENFPPLASPQQAAYSQPAPQIGFQFPKSKIETTRGMPMAERFKVISTLPKQELKLALKPINSALSGLMNSVFNDSKKCGSVTRDIYEAILGDGDIRQEKMEKNQLAICYLAKEQMVDSLNDAGNMDSSAFYAIVSEICKEAEAIFAGIK